MEIFKKIPGFEEFYEVSNLGNIRSLNTIIIRSNQRKHTVKGKLLKKGYDGKRYLTVNIKGRTRKVHQLVAMAFLNHEPNGCKIIVDHIDNNPLNNTLENLQIIDNRKNASKDKKRLSKYTGVTKKRNKWQARIYKNNQNISLGCFNCETLAGLMYQKELSKL